MRRTRGAFAPEAIVATGPGSAVASTSDAVMGDGEAGIALWRTVDDGRTWTRFVPDLPLGLDHPALANFLPDGGRPSLGR